MMLQVRDACNASPARGLQLLACSRRHAPVTRQRIIQAHTGAHCTLHTHRANMGCLFATRLQDRLPPGWGGKGAESQ